MVYRDRIARTRTRRQTGRQVVCMTMHVDQRLYLVVLYIQVAFNVLRPGQKSIIYLSGESVLPPFFKLTPALQRVLRNKPSVRLPTIFNTTFVLYISLAPNFTLVQVPSPHHSLGLFLCLPSYGRFTKGLQDFHMSFYRHVGQARHLMADLTSLQPTFSNPFSGYRVYSVTGLLFQYILLTQLFFYLAEDAMSFSVNNDFITGAAFYRLHCAAPLGLTMGYKGLSNPSFISKRVSTRHLKTNLTSLQPYFPNPISRHRVDSGTRL